MRKNNIARFCVMVVVIFLAFNKGAWADQELSLEVHRGNAIETVNLSAIIGTITYLPVRQVSELINVPLKWDHNSGSVVWQTYGKTMVITPGIETIYTVNSTVTTHKVVAKPFMEQGKVYIPIRSLELLGIGVIYDADTAQRILIIPADINLPSEPIAQEKMNLVRDLIIKEKERIPKIIGSFVTTFNAADLSRTQNLRLAAATINNFRIGSGEIFSFNETVGPRTPQRGYEIAIIYVNKKHVEGYGGGVCQVSTTLYNAVLDAGLPVVERHPHSLPVPYVPLGKDATVNYGTADFRFKNDREQDLAIQARVENNKLTVEIFLLPEDLDQELSVD